MKLLIIGGRGTIGKRVAKHFSEENEVIIAGRSQGDVIVDITDSQSIASMLEKTGTVDAIFIARRLQELAQRKGERGLFVLLDWE